VSFLDLRGLKKIAASGGGSGGHRGEAGGGVAQGDRRAQGARAHPL